MAQGRISTPPLIFLHSSRSGLQKPLLGFLPLVAGRLSKLAATRNLSGAHGTFSNSRAYILNSLSSRLLVTGFDQHKPTPSLTLRFRRKFSQSLPNMTATKIDGTAIAKDIRDRLKREIQGQQQTNPRFKPSLVIFQGKMDVNVF